MEDDEMRTLKSDFAFCQENSPIFGTKSLKLLFSGAEKNQYHEKPIYKYVFRHYHFQENRIDAPKRRRE